MTDALSIMRDLAEELGCSLNEVRPRIEAMVARNEALKREIAELKERATSPAK